jgi:hypothetical protein
LYMGVDGIDDDLTKIVWTCLFCWFIVEHCLRFGVFPIVMKTYQDQGWYPLVSTFKKKRLIPDLYSVSTPSDCFLRICTQDFTLGYGVRGFCRRGHCWSFTSSQILKKLARIVTRHLEVSLSRSELPKLCNLRWIVSDHKFEVIWRFSKNLLVSQSGVAAAWCGLWPTKFEVVWRFWETLGLFER